MNRFYNNPCPVCNKLFEQGDKIVVCPDCGTPYHEECIKQSKQCTQTHLHEKNEYWVSIQEIERQKLEEIRKLYANAEATHVCPRCNSQTEPNQKVCNICGTPLERENEAPEVFNTNDNSSNLNDSNNNPFNTHNPIKSIKQMEYNPFTTPFGGLNPEETLNGVKIKDLAAFIGMNSHSYLLKFKMMNLNASGLNFSAFIFTGFYFLYRKMYSLGVLILLAYFTLILPNLLVVADTYFNFLPQYNSFFSPDNLLMIDKVFTFFQIALMMFCGFYGNKLYKNHCVASIKQIQGKNLSKELYYETLKQKGNVNKLLIISLIAFYLIFSFMLAFVLFQNGY